MAILTRSEQDRIRAAIESAELKTSGEIQICIEKVCKGNILDRAVHHFHRLGMDATQLRNGVLIYLAVKDHKFAIIGDRGINAVVPTDFWDAVKEVMLHHFKQGNLVEGVISGLNKAGEQLQRYFPRQEDDVNELPNDISFA